MTRLSAFVMLLATAVAVAAPVPKGEKKEPYFPVTVGAKRVMERDGGNRTLKACFETVQEVTRVEERDGKHRVMVAEGSYLSIWLDGRSDPIRKPDGEVKNSVYDVTDDRVYRLSPSGAPKEAPHLLLDRTVEPGKTWEAMTFGSNPVRVTYTMGEEEEVAVPAGTYKALRVDVVCDLGGGRTQRTTQWSARGVGVVKRVDNLISGTEITTVLKSFTIEKEEKKEKEEKGDPAEDESKGK